MDLNFGKKYKDFTKEVKDFCKKYKGIHFIDSSKVPLSGSFKSGEIKMTRSDWQKILIEKGYFARSIPSEYGGYGCLLYTSPSPRDRVRSRMPSSA